MRSAIVHWSIPDTWDWRGQLAACAAAGYDGVEWTLGATTGLPLTGWRDQLPAFRDELARHDLDLVGLANGTAWGVNPAAEDPAERRRASETLAEFIACAGALGVRHVLVVPAVVDCDFTAGPVVPSQAAWDRALAFVAGALPLAEEHGVHLAIENVWNRFLITPTEMRAFIDACDSPLVGSYLDLGNALATGSVCDWIRTLGHRVQRVHVKDYRRSVGTLQGFVDLFAGEVPWSEAMAALVEIGYDDWLTTECSPPRDGSEAIRRAWLANGARALATLGDLAVPAPVAG